ncbi:MAG: hypothetical protein KJZ74_14140 [Gemmatimonadales bacterium]|nr:hypothetical protein [Gemmatimonadales bacterium]
MRRPLALAALVVTLPAVAGAQGVRDAAVIVAPHSAQYTFGSGAAERTVSQSSIPIVIVLPFSERFTMDIATAFANSDFITNGGSVSKVSGLTDTQVRANFSVGSDLVVFTVGLNVPTGQYTISNDQLAVAGQVGNDFLGYPVPSMGNGFAGTGGIAFARAMGSWNLGAGASFRKSAEFSAFEQPSGDFRFAPADEIRLRLGLDRPVGDGEVALGVSYSAFGEDVADTTTYSSGDRITVTGTWSFPVRNASAFISAWNLFRLAGQQYGGDAPAENIANVNAGFSFDVGRVLIQPNVETRLWQVDGARAGQLVNLGTRARIGAGAFSFYPAAGYTLGKIYDDAGASEDLTGYRFSLTIRFH